MSKKFPQKLYFFVYILQNRDMKTSCNMQPNTFTRRGYKASIYVKNIRKKWNNYFVSETWSGSEKIWKVASWSQSNELTRGPPELVKHFRL